MFWENFKRGFAWSIGGIFAYFLARWLKRLAMVGALAGLGLFTVWMAPDHPASAAKPKPSAVAKSKLAKPVNKIDEVPNELR